MKVYKCKIREHESSGLHQPASSIVELFTDGISWFQRHTWFYADRSFKVDTQIPTIPRSKEYLDKNGYKFAGEFND